MSIRRLHEIDQLWKRHESPDSVVLHQRESNINLPKSLTVFGEIFHISPMLAMGTTIHTFCSCWNRRDLNCIQISDNLFICRTRFTHTHCDSKYELCSVRATLATTIYRIFVHMKIVNLSCRRQSDDWVAIVCRQKLGRLRPHSTEIRSLFACSLLSFSFYIVAFQLKLNCDAIKVILHECLVLQTNAKISFQILLIKYKLNNNIAHLLQLFPMANAKPNPEIFV